MGFVFAAACSAGGDEFEYLSRRRARAGYRREGCWLFDCVGPVIVIASSFTNVGYERLPLDDGGGGGGGGGGGRDPSGGLPFLNQPLNVSGNQEQLPVDGWGGGNSGGRASY